MDFFSEVPVNYSHSNDSDLIVGWPERTSFLSKLCFLIWAALGHILTCWILLHTAANCGFPINTALFYILSFVREFPQSVSKTLKEYCCSFSKIFEFQTYPSADRTLHGPLFWRAEVSDASDQSSWAWLVQSHANACQWDLFVVHFRHVCSFKGNSAFDFCQLRCSFCPSTAIILFTNKSTRGAIHLLDSQWKKDWKIVNFDCWI